MLQIGDHVFETFGFAAHILAGGIDDVIGQTEFFRDRKSVTLTRNTGEQAVCGTQGLHIKFTAGVFHTFRR